MLPNSIDIKYFIEIAKTGNISRAAERLGLRQPSLSQAVTRLENNVGKPLFLRNKTGVELTIAGKEFLKHAQKLVTEWEDIYSKIHASESELKGLYKIGAHSSVAQNILPLILPDLIVNNPNLNFEISHDLSRKICEGVISFKLDMGFVVNPAPHPDLIIKPLYTGALTFWQSKKNANSDILICDPELLRSSQIIKDAARNNITFERVVNVQNIDVIRSMTATGAGVGLMPEKDAMRHHGNLKKLSNAPVIHDDHCLVYRMENKNVRTFQEISMRAIKLFK